MVAVGQAGLIAEAFLDVQGAAVGEFGGVVISPILGQDAEHLVEGGSFL